MSDGRATAAATDVSCSVRSCVAGDAGALARDDDMELKRIYLLQRFQGAGLGRRLLDEAAAGAHALGAQRLLLGVHADNIAAQAFYLRKGFVATGDTRRFRVGQRDYPDTIFALDLGGEA